MMREESDIGELLNKLKAKERRGSKPRCHWLTHGTSDQVAARLTALAAPFATVAADDRWMPQGFDVPDEAQLQNAPRLLEPNVGFRLAEWWLPPNRHDAQTPNFDIASTCTINAKRGLLLVEAKAHDRELIDERSGKKLLPTASDASRASHVTIGDAIANAREDLGRSTGHPWHISRDARYQMSNRFAWAWKLTELDVSVVLIYLGFLSADEMADRGQPLEGHVEWDALVKTESASLFPAEVWGRKWNLNGGTLVPLIRSVAMRYDHPLADFTVHGYD